MVQLKVGDAMEMTRTYSAEDVRAFADLSGDCNPLHLDTGAGRCRVVSPAFAMPCVTGVQPVGGGHHHQPMRPQPCSSARSCTAC